MCGIWARMVIRVGIGERPQKDGVHDAEHGGVDADS